MKHRLFPLWFLIFVVSLFLGCSSSERSLKSINSSLYLDKDQIASLEAVALQGNGDAADRLFEFYFFCVSNKSKALHWLSIAATNGNVSAQHCMGQYYLGEVYRDPVDVNKAIYWFKQAAAKGDTNAFHRLEELEK